MFNIHPIINYLKRHYPSKLIFDLRRKINRKIADTKRKPYIPMLINIVGDATVISSTCFAGRIMQDRGGVWNSPTVGLYFFAAEYIEFLTHLDYYLHEAELSFINESKYSLGNKVVRIGRGNTLLDYLVAK